MRSDEPGMLCTFEPAIWPLDTNDEMGLPEADAFSWRSVQKKSEGSSISRSHGEHVPGPSARDVPYLPDGGTEWTCRKEVSPVCMYGREYFTCQ
jgi:hypothetical protein